MNTTDSPLANVAPAATSPARAWTTVALLMLAYVSSFIDRQILSLLVIPIKRDWHLTDTQVSLLMGLSFALFYTLLGLPIGRWADRANRRNIIVIGIAVWSLMTALCGLARGYGQFFLARVGVGVGEASLSPAALSMLSDLFPRERLATAVSVYSAGIYLGSGVAVLIGAALAGMGSGAATVTLPIVGEVFRWQLVFLWIGLPGLLIAGLIYVAVPEPARRNLLTGAGQYLPLRTALALIRQQGRAFWGVTLGITFVSLVAYGSTAWIPTFVVRQFGWSVGKIGLLYGVQITVFSTLGILTGGRLADRFVRQGHADGKLRVGLIAAGGLLLSSLILLVPNPNVLVALLAFPCFFVAFPFGASSAAIQELMPNQARALASALYLFVINLIALGFGPTLVALLTDYVFHDELRVNYSLALVTAGGGAVAFGCYWWGRGAFLNPNTPVT